MTDRKRKREEAVAMETTAKGKEKEPKHEANGDKEKIDPDIKEALMREAFALKKIKKEKAAESKGKREREATEKLIAAELSGLPIKPEVAAPEAPKKKVKLNPQEEIVATHKSNLVEFLREIVAKEKQEYVENLANSTVEEFIQSFKTQAIPLWKIGMITTVVDMIMMKAQITKEDIRNFETNLPIFRQTIYNLCKLISSMK